ncbi:class I SAM-dependent methyltransferase [Ensifer soli]|uniref:class I SAM-dependent methyltransferase n=1 Tax=Ciceribacter sp. sgz301302 TaxID=3342379 RepID=UPI0035B9325E
MEILFDQSFIAARRRRALRAGGEDFLLRLAAGELVERLGVVERHFDHAVELNGHTGLTARLLRQSGKVGRVTRIEADAAFGTADDPVEIARPDTVPLPAASANLIVSPLSLHLTNDTPGVLVQVARALAPDGLFLAAIPGAGTLQELRDALLAAETELTGGASPRVIPFAGIREVGALLQRAGLALPVVDAEHHTVRYDSLFPLMADLRAMGMSNPLAARSRRPLRRDVLARAAEIYAERYSDADGRVRATFSFIYASAWKPHESQQKPLRPGSARRRLADALSTVEKKLKDDG